LPVPAVFWSTWHVDPVAAVMLAAAVWVYGRWIVVARARGERWSFLRSLSFVAALVVFAVAQFGIVGEYSNVLRWAFTLRLAALFFAVPGLAALGAPISLARLGGSPRTIAVVDRVMAWRPVRVLGNAIVSSIIPLGMFGLLLTPLSATLRTSDVVGVLVTVCIPALGFVLIAPTAEPGIERSSTFLTAEFLLTFVELMVDALPALILRVNNVVFDGMLRVPAGPAWFPSALRDQHLAGDVLIFIAEMADIPVLIALFVRWQRADKREASSIDALTDDEVEALSAEHLARFRG
jgi:putative membrane protein